ncbi:hypothetical protein ACIBQX_42300 [Nonomuraea sp. NPDC049714]|uniref:hypothetical protein n=1 Tax=Nonomuraea sp. NPDC049714 TaxID=3364357 RepID=UPI0037A333F6
MGPAPPLLPGRRQPGRPPELAGLMAAFRAGLRRDLAELVAARPNIEIHELDAGHGMLAERPEAVARLLTRLA